MQQYTSEEIEEVYKKLNIFNKIQEKSNNEPEIEIRIVNY